MPSGRSAPSSNTAPPRIGHNGSRRRGTCVPTAAAIAATIASVVTTSLPGSTNTSPLSAGSGAVASSRPCVRSSM